MRYPITHKIFRKRNHSETPKGPAPSRIFFRDANFSVTPTVAYQNFRARQLGTARNFQRHQKLSEKTKRASSQFFFGVCDAV